MTLEEVMQWIWQHKAHIFFSQNKRDSYLDYHRNSIILAWNGPEGAELKIKAETPEGTISEEIDFVALMIEAGELAADKQKKFVAAFAAAHGFRASVISEDEELDELCALDTQKIKMEQSGKLGEE